MRRRSSNTLSSTPVDMPALDPCVVDDEEGLALLLELWTASDPHRSADAECYEDALRSCLDASRWHLAARLLDLVRAAADDRLMRMVRHAFAQGRRFPLPSEEEVTP